MEECRECILKIIRKMVIWQVGLYNRHMATSIALVANPHNNNLDDLEDFDKTDLLLYDQESLSIIYD